MQNCRDDYSTTFTSFDDMLDYHRGLSANSVWALCPVNGIRISPLDEASALYGNLSLLAPGTSREAVDDTAENLGLAAEINGSIYPVRNTAYKSLLDRAKINGTALPKLSRKALAEVLNACLQLFTDNALVLIRNEKVSAIHSGDTADYAALHIDRLLENVKIKLDDRFSGSCFRFGYSDHSLTSAVWQMPNQKEDLIGAYLKMLTAAGKGTIASKLTPGIKFVSSDTGISSAKVSALLMGEQYPIHIGSCIAVEHRHGATVTDFKDAMDQLFAQFGEAMAKLQKLLTIELQYPVNAMTRVCKKLCMPKKAAVEAISMYEMAYGGGSAAAHDVFIAMQEIPFIAKSDGMPENKLLVLAENMARALSLKWSDYDLAKAVTY